MVTVQRQPVNFQQLKLQLGTTSGNLSVQLNKLKDAGLVSVQKSFNGKMPNTLCKLTDKGNKQLIVYKNAMARLLKIE